MPLKIGEVARRAGVSVEAIRYYERLGLIARAPRTPSGYRKFDPEVLRRLQFVQRAQALGFSLEEIRDLLELRVASDATAADVRTRAEEKLSEIEAKIAALQAMRGALRRLMEACCGSGPTGACPILDALDGSDDAVGRR